MDMQHTSTTPNNTWTNPLTQEALEAVLGFRVLSWPASYVTAFTHKSAVGYPGAARESYEKLEFLGDAVLGFIVGRYLFETYPNGNEGFLSKMRTKLVSGKALSDIALRMGLQHLIIMSPKALHSKFNLNARILEDVLESLIGAIFLDAGMVAARSFVMNMIHLYVDREALLKNTNYKDMLMQLCQARGEPLPIYTATETENRTFHVVAVACGMQGSGHGTTKRKAEQMAAKHALINLGIHVDD